MELIDKINFNISVNQEVVRRLNLIDNFELTWDKIELSEKRELLELKKIATVQSIGSSTRIEGATLTDTEVNTLIKDIKITSMESRDEQEVVGYYEVLDLIHESFESIDLNANIIKQLHSMLLKHSSKDQRHKGDYKNLSNKVVANYPDGTERVVFKTTEPHLTGKEMFELVNWVSDAETKAALHPIIIVAVFVYEFLSIHPFQDGNGRLSRLLTTLLLLKSKYRFVQYISFENHIEHHKESYYSALMNGQKRRNSDAELIEEWVLFFVGSLNSLTDKLQVKYESLNRSEAYLSDRHKKIVAFIQKNKVVKFGDLSKRFKNINPSSIKKDLAYLSQIQAIKKLGVLKATEYCMF